MAINNPKLPPMTYEELISRKQAITERLNEIALTPQPKKKRSSSTVPYAEKTDTHQDFLLKEMQWLAADFSGERKRHLSMRRKLAAAVRGFHQSKETRRLRELADAELKRRKLAARLGREVRGWWTKIERVIGYKQKLSAEEERRSAMNKQLVALVKQTEKYSDSLARNTLVEDDSEYESTDEEGGRRCNRLTIEEALASGSSRRSKSRVTDYARLQLDRDESSFYGESTADESGSDASYSPEEDEDDESTLQRAEEEELDQRRRAGVADLQRPFAADPIELRRLEEESTMDINVVLQRLKSEGEAADDDVHDDDPEPRTKRVKFAEQVEVNSLSPVLESPSRSRLRADPGEEADDDADASDVEDFVYDDNLEIEDGSEDFVGKDEADDETTIEQEERLPQDMTADEEISLLKAEGELSVEELWQRYADALGSGGSASQAAGQSELENDDDQPGEVDPMDVDDSDDGSEEYVADAAEIDDEATIAEEEALPKEMSAEQEIRLLEAEREMPIEELRRRYSEALAETAPDDANESSDDQVEAYDDESEEYHADDTEVDDETTIALEEQLPQEMSASEEIQLLEAENELSVEELRKRYAGAFVPIGGQKEDESSESQSVDNVSASDSEEGASTAALLSGAADDDGDGEFEPDSAAVDDETTIEAEESMGRDMSYEEELSLLRREGEMSVEELKALYSGMDGAAASEDESGSRRSYLEEALEDEENDDEFEPTEEAKDDETTIEAEERLGREMSAQEEIALLQQESEQPIQSLLERYRLAESRSKRKRIEAPAKETDSGEDTSDAGQAALDALEASAERARNTKATRPYLLAPWVKLREYQQVGLNWLVSLQTRRLNGILADEMGLGKTLQTISLLAYLASYKGIWGPHLIIVPTSVILNWETELKRFCPALKVLCYYGSAKRRKELRTGWTKTNWYHVVITSYQLAVQDAFAFKRKKWYYLVLDEAQNIKNFQSQRWQTLINFNTQRRLLLTGTPLQNNLMELWSLLHFLMPYIFRSRKEFSYWFANPMNSLIEGSNKNDDVVQRLHGIIRPFVLRRLKKDVETQLPGKFEHIIKCQMSRRQMFIYEEFLARSSTRQALKAGGNFLSMMNVLMQLRKVVNHPDLFEPRSVVTPFVLDPIVVPMPACIHGVLECKPPLEVASEYLRMPLWSGSRGLSSSDGALRHDSVESRELLALEAKLPSNYSDADLLGGATIETLPAGLKALLDSISQMRRSSNAEQKGFLEDLNCRRCRADPFVYSSRLVQAVNVGRRPVDGVAVDHLSSPSALLGMIRDQQQWADASDELVKRFVFCVPKAGSTGPRVDTRSSSDVKARNVIEEVLLEPLEEMMAPFRKAQARLSSFFPDKKLVQFDAGKLQTLAELLRELKRGGHRVLIFTQMSKMLDILEAFLNLNGHTYLRLDGSTGVDRRQRLMDRFNSDPKVFCFILSTRSGGLGINLTGADSVIFYDMDWNPAMDAQAQDRAHRIGQTREVHIYRLVTEHSVEENILLKAQQKRNLDILVMDRGKFDASQLFGHGENAKAVSHPDEIQDVYTKGGLRAILGVTEERADPMSEEPGVSAESMEQAMTTLEDVDDVQALRGAQKEAADELKEFDENEEIKKSSDSEDEDDENKAETKTEPEKNFAAKDGDAGDKDAEELEKEFAAWQDKVGMDAAAIEASLGPAERYGLRFREEIDPYYSIFAVKAYQRRLEAQAEADEEIDVEDLEKTKGLEERQAMDDGDLLATRPDPEDLIRQRELYRRERARLRANKKRRKLTGENWEQRVDGLTKHAFWYNIDTGEATWDKPSSLLELEGYELAEKLRYAAIPLKPLVNVMSFLSPMPDRVHCATVCRQWQAAATDFSFVRHVYPVEMGTRDDSKMEFNHFRTIADALAHALPGDTIELGDGHYWANDDMCVEFPIRFVGDEHNPANVVIEMSGTLVWRARGGWCEGITFRRPKILSAETSSELLRMEGEGRIDIIQCLLDNEGSSGNVASASGTGFKGKWSDVALRGGNGGLSLKEKAVLELSQIRIQKCREFGVRCKEASEVKMIGCEVNGAQVGVQLLDGARASLSSCRILKSARSIIEKAPTAVATCTNNVATKSIDNQTIPGFRFVKT